MRKLYGEIEEQQQSNADIQRKVHQMFMLNAKQLKERKFLDTVPKESLVRLSHAPAPEKIK
jgi:hypothetical protein